MNTPVTVADAALATVLAARTSPDAAVLVVVLRGGYWSYSCGLARAVHALTPDLSAAGAEVLLLAAEPEERQHAITTAWQLSFGWLPEAVTEPVARDLGAWDTASGRALDGLGLLSPDGTWLLRRNQDDFGSADPPDAFLTVLRGEGLPPAPAPSQVDSARLTSIADTDVISLERASGKLRRALASAAGLPAAVTRSREGGTDASKPRVTRPRGGG
ncbi:hypothetical protein OHB14_51280 [Streptomyces sp. NBC_01613]|uniref:hypothetical protein n=1 Tax=Streptomyces sp. NBC_01613 TaxID=2975896 RepID=UPI003867754E